MNSSPWMNSSVRELAKTIDQGDLTQAAGAKYQSTTITATVAGWRYVKTVFFMTAAICGWIILEPRYRHLGRDRYDDRDAKLRPGRRGGRPYPAGIT